MATKQTSNFPTADCELADFAGALAHPARINIMKLLQDWGEAPCGQIVEALPLSQASVSQHLNCLLKAGLLKQRQCGKRYCYSIDSERVRNFCHTFQRTLGTKEADGPRIDKTSCRAEETAGQRL
ncbi:MAG: ArsR/SmtB family transcription factor [Opitutales bacterium]